MAMSEQKRLNQKAVRSKDRVYIEDLRVLKYCKKGSQQRLTALGLNLRQLVSEGLPFETLETVDDVMVARAIEQAKKRQREGA